MGSYFWMSEIFLVKRSTISHEVLEVATLDEIDGEEVS